jgi:hypothetical protein
VVVEKILEEGERLPASWAADGTTGYDFTNLVGGLFVDPDGEEPLTDLYESFTGSSSGWDDVVRESKELVVRDVLASELARLTTLFVEVAGWNVPVIGGLPDSLPAPSLPGFAAGQLHDLFGAAIAVAALAAIESLLSARVADGMSDGAHHDPDRELFGQGLANLASPLFGGMPATGAIARTCSTKARSIVTPGREPSVTSSGSSIRMAATTAAW